ncbi:MAG: cysteine peptidase family C39 domain-containing protein [Planctomycetota bacterium]|nr:cysteine peptidase family C39 domain-containing protein [Planctomycetota bacterium]
MTNLARFCGYQMLAITMVACLLSAHPKAFGEDSRNLLSHHICRDALMCGPNGLYIFLKLNGVATSFSAIEKYIPSNDEGMSINELQHACLDFGLDTEIRRCSVEELGQAFKEPIIAYTTTPNSSTGHYMLILGISRNGVDVMDPTTGESWMTSLHGLSATWRGYILTPIRSPPLNTTWTIRSMLAWTFLFCGSIYFSPSAGGCRVSS